MHQLPHRTDSFPVLVAGPPRLPAPAPAGLSTSWAALSSVGPQTSASSDLCWNTRLVLRGMQRAEGSGGGQTPSVLRKDADEGKVLSKGETWRNTTLSDTFFI